MTKSKRRREQTLRADALKVVLARPQLIALSPEQEREALRLHADLFAQAARRRGGGELREAA